MNGTRRLQAWTLAHFLVDLTCFWFLAGLFSQRTGSLALAASGYLVYNALAFGLQPVFGTALDRVRAGDIAARKSVERKPVTRKSATMKPVTPKRAAASEALGIAGCLLTGITLIAGALSNALVFEQSVVATVHSASHVASFFTGATFEHILLWALLALIAVGNALFHVGAGVSVLCAANGRFSDSGVFISSGALGVVLGIWLGALPFLWSMLAGGSLLAVGWVITRQPRSADLPRSIGELPSVQMNGASQASSLAEPFRLAAHLVVLLCLAAILVRAFAGSFTPVVWRSRTNLLLYFLPALCVFAGKLAGGFLADRHGARRVAVLSLLAAVPLLFLRADMVLPTALGMAAVSMTTAITVTTIAGAMPGREGFAFGLTTLALLAGSLPGYFMKLSAFTSTWLLPGLTLFAALCLALALNRQLGRMEHEDRNGMDDTTGRQTPSGHAEKPEYPL